jgi:nitrate/nitrite-specific signal transduction histidine kinase
VSIDPPANTLMSRDPELARRVVDVVSEGLTNAVRHASARTVTLTISSFGMAGVEVDVSHPGVLVPGESGQGSAVLDGACEEWARTTDGAQVTLECRLTSRAMSAA